MINTKKFDSYQLEEYNKKQNLMAELKSLANVPSQSLWIEQGDNGRGDFRLIMQGEKYNFLINRDYNKNVTVSIYPYQRYARVDYHKAGEVRKSIMLSNNMKIITVKKLAEKIAEEIKLHEKLTDLDRDNADKVAEFLGNIKASGEVVRYSYKYQESGDTTPKQITGGYIERNGLEYSFEISDSGYISQKIRTNYRASTTLETFKNLADNKYQDNA